MGSGSVSLVRKPLELSTKWAGGKTTIHFIPEYYNYGNVTKWLESQGIHQVDEGHHDDLAMEATLTVVDPTVVRMKERIAAGKFSINGVALAPIEKTIALGKRILDYRADATIEAIKKALGK